MAAFLAERFPLWQIIGSLFLDIRLGVRAVRAVEFLHNRVLHADFLDSLVERGEGIGPRRKGLSATHPKHE